MPLSGIISSCWGIQTFIFIKACSQEWLNDQPGLINMWIKTRHDKFKCLLAQCIAKACQFWWICFPFCKSKAILASLLLIAAQECHSAHLALWTSVPQHVSSGSQGSVWSCSTQKSIQFNETMNQRATSSSWITGSTINWFPSTINCACYWPEEDSRFLSHKHN